MSSGAITLQCPHCGGVFLTLQHSGIIEICPHCAVGAPRASFTPSSDPIGVRPRADLPPAKREASSRPGPTPARADSPAPLFELPFPMAPEVAPPAAPAPMSAFVQAVPSVHAIVPRSAPETKASPSNNGGSPLPPAATPDSTPEPAVTPDAAARSGDDRPIMQSALWPPASTVFAAPDSHPTGDAETPASTPPVWPGLDRDEAPGGAAPPPPGTLPRLSGLELEHRRAPRRRTPWLTLAMLFILISSVTWLALQTPQPVSLTPDISLPQPEPTLPTEAPAVPDDTATTSTATAPPPEPVPEVKPAIPNATPDAVAALRAKAAEEHLASLTGDMVKGLEKAVTDSDRLRWLDASPEQQAGVDRFFEIHHGKFEPLQLEPSAGKVTLLPSGEEIKLFRLTTATCPEGAILQVREDGGRARMRWGLFEQSHEKTYDRFLASTDRNEPARWFILLCQRAHSLGPKGPAKDAWICFDAQGSLGAGGTGQVYLNKDSPVGRFLEPKALWGRLYLAELLVAKMEIDGRLLNVVLDCAGVRGGGTP